MDVSSVTYKNNIEQLWFDIDIRLCVKNKEWLFSLIIMYLLFVCTDIRVHWCWGVLDALVFFSIYVKKQIIAITLIFALFYCRGPYLRKCSNESFPFSSKQNYFLNCASVKRCMNCSFGIISYVAILCRFFSLYCWCLWHTHEYTNKCTSQEAVTRNYW